MPTLHAFAFQLMKSLSHLARAALQTGELGPRGVQVYLMVSGGKDSMALMHAVHSFANSPKFCDRATMHFRVLHCDHQTRSGDSTTDAEFVSQQALNCGFPVLHAVWSRPEPKLGSQQASSFQAQASAWRRSVCQSILRTHGPACLFVTAHHAADRAEGILLNLIRGTSAAGLAGMRAFDTEQHVIRPMLDVSLCDLQDYLQAMGIPHREDSSNQSLRYARNNVRHVLVPLLQSWNPDIIAAINRAGDSVAATMGKTFDPEHPQEPEHGGACPAPSLGDHTEQRAWLAAEIRRRHPGYLRLLTQSQLDNLAHHAHLSRVRGGMLTQVPLSKGWLATFDAQGFRLVDPVDLPQGKEGVGSETVPSRTSSPLAHPASGDRLSQEIAP